MNNEQQELLDEAYKNYLQHYSDEYNEEQKKLQKNPLHWMEMEYTNIRPYPKEEFIRKCKTDSKFSEKWGLTIEERELIREEKWELYFKSGLNIEINGILLELKHMGTPFYPKSLPNKLITITYHNKTIESY
jgi:hypothetical protein